VPEENTTTETSPAGGDGGQVPEGFVSQAQFDATEAKRRDLQSKLDKANASLAARPEPTTQAAVAAESAEKDRIAALEAQVAKLASFDPDSIADQFTARFNQQQALAAAKLSAKEKYANARPEVLNATYESPEELIAAVEASHQAETSHRAEIAAAERARISAELKEKHGIALEPSPQTTAPEGGSTAADGVPQNQRDLAALSTSEYLALDDDVRDKALKVA
jgi:hypothetical protein